MIQSPVLREIAVIGIQAGFWAAVMFPVLTAWYWPWWKHQWGWTVVCLDAAIAFALLGDIMVIEFGLRPGSTPGHVLAWVEAISLCLIPVIIVWRAALVFVTQWRGSHGGDAD